MVTVLLILTIGLPWVGAILVWGAGDARPRTQHALAAGFALAGSVASVGLFAFASPQVVIGIPLGAVVGDLSFVADGLGCLLAVIALVIGALTVIFSTGYMRGEQQLGRYYSLILLFIGAMAGLVLTNNLFILFLFWELVALCSYALISFYSDNPKAVAGGIKAFIVTQVGGIGLLIGTLTVYAYLGSYNLNTFLSSANKLPANILSLIAFCFLIAAAAKSAQVPFHTWLPGAMEAPTPVSALIHAATMVNAGVYLLARFYPALAVVPDWRNAVVAIGVLSALLGALLALFSTDLKRILAYSTISQLGYMFYAVGIGAVFASQFHLLSHAVFKGLLFLMAGAVTHAVGTRDIRDMGGLSRRLPIVCITAWIGSLALIGIPFMNGFWSKELILEAGVADSQSGAFALMMVGLFLTGLYTLRMMGLVFYGKPHSPQTLHNVPTIMQAVLIVLAVATAITWLLGEQLGNLFTATLPFHALHPETVVGMVEHVFSAPTTYVALAIIGVAAIVWLVHGWFVVPMKLRDVIEPLVESDFGFGWLNTFLSQRIRDLATIVLPLQTGKLNWNIVGILIGLISILLILGVRP